MAQSFADFYKVDTKTYQATGALDPILNIDTRLFIDPSFLRLTTTPELLDSYPKLLNHFDDVLKVVKYIKNHEDRFWRKADELLTFPEVNGLCIGYGKSGTAGSGMGPKIRAKLLSSVIEIVNVGVEDPVIFEIVGAFEEDVGPDRISDMIAKIIISDLISFTQRVCSDCGIPMESLAISKHLPEEDLPLNPFNSQPIILVPREVLNDLPVVAEFSDIQWVAKRNAQVRDDLNRLIGASWRNITLAERKKALRSTFVDHPEVLIDLIETYKKAAPDFYDFKDDPSGEVIWYSAAKEISQRVKLSLALPPKPTVDDVEKVVIEICLHFQKLVEDNQLCKLLYDKGGNRKHESAAQLLFFGIADAYCKANNLDLSPESDGGRGPVDFKISSGYEGRVLVEIKLTSNNQLEHGFVNQLPIYEKAEHKAKGIYLVIDNGGATKARMDRFRKKIEDVGKLAPKVMFVDGIVRASASVANE